MKVYTIDELAEVTKRAKAEGNKVGLCHGCFDIIHIGHVHHFKAARALCDILYVSVTADRYVNKGPDRPVIPEDERVEIISNLRDVSGAMINDTPTSTELLSRVLPSVYFKGQEYLNGPAAKNKNFLAERDLAYSLGIEVEHTFEKVCSSSKIISTLIQPD